MYEIDARARFSEVDADAHLSIAGIVDYFQDCTLFQSEELGVGVQWTIDTHLCWVLNFWQIEIVKRPRLGDRFTVGTAPISFRGFFGDREFRMCGPDGELYARARSVWTLLDTDTFKPQMIPDYLKEIYVLGEPQGIPNIGRKIKCPEGGVTMKPVTVSYAMLDTNHHMNNGQYILLAQSFLPEGCKVREVRCEYRKQAFEGDVMFPVVNVIQGESVTSGEGTLCEAIQGESSEEAMTDVKMSDEIFVSLGGEDGSVYAVVQFITER